MIKSVAFQTKARTVDHLGREQIADCPTAISELWKNAYDAYARNVALDLFAGEIPVALISDDGHGMNQEEFETKWLVVGTESKATSQRTPVVDRNGLSPRVRQGQKGIGRLSCANLGPVLLLVSKRTAADFVAALLDWRLFENPFMNLADIEIPLTEFSAKEELFERLPDLALRIATNVRGDQGDRGERIRAAWAAYDLLHHQDRDPDAETQAPAPSAAILQDAAELPFTATHLATWPVWEGTSDHGTALLVTRINYDLAVELDQSMLDASARGARDRFFETLTSFVDPFFDPATPGTAASQVQFAYAVRAWNGDKPRHIVGAERQFDRRTLDGMEHMLEGVIDEGGVFRGRVKAFGQWVEGECVIEPPNDLIIPRRADTEVGPFGLYIAAMEFQAANTTLPRHEFVRFQELAKLYSGFMVFRDGLRVLPYGRTDNDFFEIEMRRSKSAGREFWNHRQMFGRLAIRRGANPNLKDKAGREGLLDNRAAKTLKALVSNILMLSARRYFGSDSDARKTLLPEIQETNREQRAAEARNKLRQRQRREFRSKLQRFLKEVPPLVGDLESFAQGLSLKDEGQIDPARERFEGLRDRVAEYRLPGAPKTLGSLEENYADYRDLMREAGDLLGAIEAELQTQIERIRPTRPRFLLERQLARNGALIHRRILGWKRVIDVLQRGEFERIRDLVAERNKLFHAEATPLLARFDRGEVSYSEASRLLDRLKDAMDGANEELFVPYVGALEALKESIDLEHLAAFGADEAGDLRNELERLTGLAQLGIAVEIVGHELQNYDDIIGDALARLPADVRASKPVQDIAFGYDGLTDQLRFLSPLRLAGQRIQRWITGSEIADYLSEFFRIPFARNAVSLEATEAFRKLRIYDQQSRLLPVFINLVNNSIYWVCTRPTDRRIALHLLGPDVVVSDNGPGVATEDLASLFSLFFTKKARGGRGVGLYLARANLAAGGHTIRYEPDVADMPLDGANFVISFRGAEYDGD